MGVSIDFVSARTLLSGVDIILQFSLFPFIFPGFPWVAVTTFLALLQFSPHTKIERPV